MQKLEMQTLPLLAPPGSERACFICLEDDGDLVSCCSQCFGVVHIRCWRECRSSQRSNAIRSRMTAQGGVRDPFMCSICKTGRSRVPGETVTREWMEVVLSAVLSRSRRGFDDSDSQLDMFEDIDDEESRFCCTRGCFLLNFIVISTIMFSASYLVSRDVYPVATVLLLIVLILMQFIVTQISFAIAKYRRSWRESHRPLNALIDQELEERRGRLFPLDLVVVP